eukprot:scaffold71215_cov33-Prasinocladus_malaysianus.AAC.1
MYDGSLYVYVCVSIINISFYDDRCRVGRNNIKYNCGRPAVLRNDYAARLLARVAVVAQNEQLGGDDVCKSVLSADSGGRHVQELPVEPTILWINGTWILSMVALVRA